MIFEVFRSSNLGGQECPCQTQSLLRGRMKIFSGLYERLWTNYTTKLTPHFDTSSWIEYFLTCLQLCIEKAKLQGRPSSVVRLRSFSTIYWWLIWKYIAKCKSAFFPANIWVCHKISGWQSIQFLDGPNICAMFCFGTIRAACSWKKPRFELTAMCPRDIFKHSQYSSYRNVATLVKYCKVCCFQSVGESIGRCLENGSIWEQASMKTQRNTAIVGEQ